MIDERGRFGRCVRDVFWTINHGGSSCDIFGIVSPVPWNIEMARACFACFAGF
jgi:hypothetical protein